MTTGPSLIINADDYGWDGPASEGILLLAAQGKITSTTIMANCATPRQLDEIKAATSLSIGLHVNLFQGKPSSRPSDVPSIIDNNGMLLPQKAFLRRFLTGRINFSDIALEIKNQMNRLANHGIEISHVDSHQHVHQYPVIGPKILDILRHLGCEKIRRCNVRDRTSRKMQVVKLFDLMTARSLSGFRSPGTLITSFSDRRDANLDIFHNSIGPHLQKDTVIEFMTHPATQDRPGSYLSRKAEFDFWMTGNWTGYLEKHHVSLISYHDL